jgi:hypothetical protein
MDAVGAMRQTSAMEQHPAPRSTAATRPFATTRHEPRQVRVPLSREELDVVLGVLRYGPAARFEVEAERRIAQAVEAALAAGFEVVPEPR